MVLLINLPPMTTTTPPPGERVPPPPRPLTDPNFFGDVPHLAAASERLAATIPDPAVRHATVLFGDGVLVPLLADDPAPEALLANLTKAEHLSLLSQNSFGVLCGVGSAPVGALRLPERVLTPFFRDNPAITESAIFMNAASRQVACFVRSPALPPACFGQSPGPEWISGGRVLPICDRETTLRLACLQPLPVRQFALAGLNWNVLPDLGMEIAVAEIAAQHGPELLTGRGMPRLNPSFWAALYLTQLHIRYDRADRVFRTADAGGHEVEDTSIQRDLARFLHAHSQRPNCEALLHYREPRHLQRIIKQMKLFGDQSPPSQLASLAAFMAQSVSACPGETVTAEELYRGYKIFCTLNRLTAATEIWFAGASARWLKQHLGVAKCHSIQRDGTARRGFRDIGLLPPR